MRRQMAWFLVLIVLCATPAFSFDGKAFSGALKDLADGISQTAYSLVERENSAERQTYEAASAKAETAERTIRQLVNQIDNPKDLASALRQVQTFKKGNDLTAHTAGVVLKALQERAAFLNVQNPSLDRELKAVTTRAASSTITRAAAPEILMSRTQRRLILVETPIAEACLSISDNGKGRRLEHLEGILKRHECRIVSSMIDSSAKDPKTNFYVSGKKFVLESLLRHYGGQAVTNDLRAILAVTTGGFWAGTKTLDFTIAPNNQRPEIGNLDWYRAVLEKDPMKFLAESSFAKLSQLGQMETIGGDKKLRLKNTKVTLWVIPSSGTKTDAIYTADLNLGDLYVDSH